jgi:hypothetical protein
VISVTVVSEPDVARGPSHVSAGCGLSRNHGHCDRDGSLRHQAFKFTQARLVLRCQPECVPALHGHRDSGRVEGLSYALAVYANASESDSESESRADSAVVAGAGSGRGQCPQT